MPSKPPKTRTRTDAPQVKVIHSPNSNMQHSNGSSRGRGGTRWATRGNNATPDRVGRTGNQEATTPRRGHVRGTPSRLEASRVPFGNTSVKKPQDNFRHGSTTASASVQPSMYGSTQTTSPMPSSTVQGSSAQYSSFQANGAPSLWNRRNPKALSARQASETTERPLGPFKGILTMSELGGSDILGDENDTVTIVAQIEKRYDVRIECLGDAGSFHIHAQTKERLNESSRAIVAALKHQALNAWRPEILVSPPNVDLQKFEVKFVKQQPSGVRPTKSFSAGSLLLVDTSSNDQSRPLEEEYGRRFRLKTFQIIKALKTNPDELRMRVHFGTVLLKEWQREKETYSYAELVTATRRAAQRSTFKMDRLLGSFEITHEILSKIYDSSHLFEPATGRLKDLKAVTPKHTLILRTAGVDLETEVIGVLDNDQASRKYRLGPATAYRRDKSGRAVEIITSCPACTYDWSLEVSKMVGIASVSFTHQDMERNVSFNSKDQSHEFPMVGVNQAFALQIGLEALISKTSWTFVLRNTPYQIEVGRYLKQCPGSTEKLPIEGCGITLSGIGWDDELGSKDIAQGPREWSEGYPELFHPDYNRGSGEDGLARFLRCVGTIGQFLDEVNETHAAREKSTAIHRRHF